MPDIQQAWGDGMPIKMQAWFKGLRWDAVLLRQAKPSLVPQLKDAMDVSNFDQVFTGDRSWKHSNLLRNSIVSIDTTEDPFADFHYVSRPSMDRKMRDGMGGVRNAGSRPTGRGPPVRYDVMDKGRMSIDQFRDKQRLSSEMSTDDALQERRRSSSTADTASAIYSIADGTGSLDGDEQVGNPCSPWHPCDNGHTDKSIRGKRLSAEAALSGVRESAERSSMDGVGQHSSDDEQLEEGDNSHHSSHMTKQKIRSYRCNIPIAKEGFLESAKKAVVAATVAMNFVALCACAFLFFAECTFLFFVACTFYIFAAYIFLVRALFCLLCVSSLNVLCCLAACDPCYFFYDFIFVLIWAHVFKPLARRALLLSDCQTFSKIRRNKTYCRART